MFSNENIRPDILIIDNDEYMSKVTVDKEHKVEYMTKAEAEELLGYTLGYKLYITKEIKDYKILNGRCYIKKDVIIAMLESDKKHKEEYMTKADAEELLGYTLECKLYKTKEIKDYKILNGRCYIKKDVIIAMLEFDTKYKEEYMTKAEAEELLGYTLERKLYKTKEIEDYKNLNGCCYIKKDEILAILELDKKHKEEYMTKAEAEELLGYVLRRKLYKTKEIKDYKILNGRCYIKKDVIIAMLESDKKHKEEYMTKAEAEELLGYTLERKLYKTKEIKDYKNLNGRCYIKKDVILAMLESDKKHKEEYMTKAEAEELLGYTLGRKLYKTKEIKDYKNLNGSCYIKKDVILAMLESDKKHKEEYMTKAEAEELLGYDLDYRIYVTKEFKTCKILNRSAYIKREEIFERLEFEKKFKEGYMTKAEAEEMVGYSLDYKIYVTKEIKTCKILNGNVYIKQEEILEIVEASDKKFKEEHKAITEMNEYITGNEAKKLLEYNFYNIIYKNISFKKINNIKYINEKEVAELLKAKKEVEEIYMSKAEAEKLIGNNRLKAMINSKKIKTYKVINRHGFISRKEIKELIEASNNFEENYISVYEAEKDLGIKFKTLHREDYLETYEIYNGKAYIKKTELENIRKLKDENIPRLEFIKINKLPSKIVNNAIVVLKIKEITKCPFFGVRNLLKNEDAERILDYIEYKKEKGKLAGFAEKFKFHIRDIPIKPKLEKTVCCFNEFMVKKSKSFKTEYSIKAQSKIYANAYVILLNSLEKEFNEYSSDQVDSILKLLIKNNKYTKNGKKVFVHFINYIIEAWNLKQYKKYKYEEDYTKHKKVVGYTQRQFLELLALLHNAAKNRAFLTKAIDNRTYAMAWLYMYLHYVTIWRSNDLIKKIPPPNLLHLYIPEVNNGESFLNWLSDEKNIFTDEMGEIMSEDVRRKIHALNKKTGKTNQSLCMEVGRLAATVLGLLLAICEAHRDIAEKSGHKGIITDTILTGNVVTQYKKNNIYDTIFDGKVKDILGEKFGNRKANKSYNNYIHNYSEKKHSKFAVHLISILRGYVDEESQTTTIYETRKYEGTIDAVVATLFDRGSFAFAKFKLLEAQDEAFLSLDFDTQTEVIHNLEVTPYQAEMAVKSIYNARKTITSLLAKMSTQSMKMHEIMEELAFGETESKHNHARCLYKALLNSGINEVKDLDIDDIDGFMFIEILKDYRNRVNCIHPDTPTCFGCPMMIGEMYLLYELKEVLLETINNLNNCLNEFEQYIYSDILYNSYLPILREAKATLGATHVGFIINFEYLKNELYKLHMAGKVKLKRFTGGKDDFGITEIGR